MYHDIQLLKDAGYEVEQCSPYHFKIYKSSNEYVNIWPSANKYMKAFGKGASYYSNIFEAVESIVGKPHQTIEIPEAWSPTPPTPYQQQCYEEWTVLITKFKSDIENRVKQNYEKRNKI